jgi:hypothetical protein
MAIVRDDLTALELTKKMISFFGREILLLNLSRTPCKTHPHKRALDPPILPQRP